MMRLIAAALLATASACTTIDAGDTSEPLLGAPRLGVAQAHVVERTADGPPPKLSPLRVSVAQLTSDAQDPALVDAWGFGFDDDASGGPRLWIAAAGTDTAACTDATGVSAAPSVAVAGGPTGVAYTPSTTAENEFDGDELVFTTAAGTIAGWADGGGPKAAVRVDHGAAGAVYTGVTVSTKGVCNKVVAADFANGTVDAFDDYYGEDPAAFVDPTMPAGFAPYNVFASGTDVYVAYARQSADRHDAVPGAGAGYVDVFAHEGTFERRLISGGHLDAPWGMMLVPATGWGVLSGKLLVANSGDGAIHVYDPATGAWKGQLQDGPGYPLAIDGVRAIAIGPKTATVDLSDRIFFTAGPGGALHGVVGTLQLIH